MCKFTCIIWDVHQLTWTTSIRKISGCCSKKRTASQFTNGTEKVEEDASLASWVEVS